jgi:hypothetical protein
MFIYSNGLIIRKKWPKLLNFVGSDTQENYNKNLNTMPLNWYYKDKTIEYNYNSLGFRSKEFSEINYENYIICIGCSFTEGVGLENKFIYPNLLADYYNTDLVNLGMGMIGNDCVTYNLLSFYSANIKPKFVICQWPDPSRLLIRFQKQDLGPFGVWTNENSIKTLISISNLTGYEYTKFELFFNLIQHIIKVPIVHITLDTRIKFPIGNSVYFNKIDQARDNHYGILSHNILTQQIVKELKSLL